MARSHSAEIRERLDHPVIDGDAHYLEFAPLFFDTVREVAGNEMAELYAELRKHLTAHLSAPVEERRRNRDVTAFWGLPTENTLDRMTATLPSLYYRRLDEMGLDFAVLYPTLGAFCLESPIDELRQALSRSFNEYAAAAFGPYANRMTPVAVIPMHTPEEAIAELEHAASLGLKVALISGFVRRPHPAIAESHPELARHAYWIDTYGVDSAHDYDPVWAKCIELGMPVATHTAAMGLHERSSPSNYMYNHMGHFAAAGEALCKSLFLGGVTRRFPRLRVACLEGGATTGVRLYHDLHGRWEKRGAPHIHRLNPANLDRSLALRLFREHAPELMERYGHLGEEELLFSTEIGMGNHVPDLAPEAQDDFAACGIERPEDIADLFIPNFYFGCEADDALAAWAFRREANPLGEQVRVIMSSDNGHWDVVDMSHALAEAWELVDRGLLSKEEFRDYCFTNSLRLYAGNNPDFFEGTVLEDEARRGLAAQD